LARFQCLSLPEKRKLPVPGKPINGDPRKTREILHRILLGFFVLLNHRSNVPLSIQGKKPHSINATSRETIYLNIHLRSPSRCFPQEIRKLQEIETSFFLDQNQKLSYHPAARNNKTQTRGNLRPNVFGDLG
jgi:hypothetical protein